MSDVGGNEQHQYLSENHLQGSTSKTPNPLSPSSGLEAKLSQACADTPTTPSVANESNRASRGSTTANQSGARRSTRLSTSSVAVPEYPATDTSGKGKKRVPIDEIPTLSNSRKKPRTSSTVIPASQSEVDSTPTRSDRKGKKRAARSPTPLDSEKASSAEPKRARKLSGVSPTGRYELRSKPEEDKPVEASSEISTAKQGKGKSPATSGTKSASKMPKKAMPKQKKAGPGAPSNDRAKKGDSSRLLVDDGMDEDDSLWIDEAGISGMQHRRSDDDEDDDDMDGSDHEEEDDEDDEDNAGDEGAGLGGGSSGSGGVGMNRLARLAADGTLDLDEATATALFGRGFSVFGGMMSGMSNRFKRLKKNLQSRKAATRLNALRECSELLLVSNEDTLGSSFSPTNFATEFIAILNGRPNIDNEGASDEEPPALDEMDEDAQLAAALALSAGNAMPALGGNEDEMESQLLACRCLAHLLEALPGTGHTLVHLGAVPALCSKLTEISYIELAEQTLSTLEKISAEYPAAIVREGGLGALLNYLPFFSTNVQRTAVTAAANCCRNISSEHYMQIKEVFPTLRDTLSSGDQRLVEQATLAVLRTLEAYRHNGAHLEGLLDLPTVAAVNALLIPSGGSPLISPSTYTHLLKALTTSARGSAKVSIAFLEAGMTSTIYQILTGVLPPSHDEDEQGESSGGQGLAGGIADMAVLQNLAHRPKDQVEEALALICELLPPVPRDGVFDPKAYTEKSLSRLRRGRKSDRSDKTDRAPRRSSRVAEAAASSSDPATPTSSNAILQPSSGEPVTPLASSSHHREAALLKAKTDLDVHISQRLDLLSANPVLVSRFIKAVVPVLVDVYAASVVLRVRTKVLTGLVKAVAFAQHEALVVTLKSVPMASFLCAIIASRDNPALVLNALHLVELLAVKMPGIYQASFQREGVIFEIDALANQELAKDIAEKARREAELVKAEPEDTSTPVAAPQNPSVLPTIPDELKPLLSLANLPGGLTFLNDPSGNLSTPKRTSSYLDPNDANIIRARVLQAKRIFDVGGDHHHAATKVLDEVGNMVQELCRPTASEAELRETLRNIAARFGHIEQSLSSFELLKSGLVDGLLNYVDISGEVSSPDRRVMLFETFSDTTLATPSPLTMLVKRLHESLGRLENFEVETAFGGGVDPSRPNGSSLARTLRIKLQAEDGQDIPKQVQQLSITIQAIAPMQALHDYLRPRVADGNFGSGLSRIFAAYASGMPLGGAPGGGASRLLDALTGGNAAGGSSSATSGLFGSVPAAASSAQPAGTGDAASSGAHASGTGDTAQTPADGSNKSPKVQRRRSARLSAQGLTDDAATTGTSAPVPATLGPVIAAETAPLSSSAPEPTILPPMPMDMDFDDDYSDDDYDAEVYDEEMEEEIARPTERVVNMSVVADGTRVEAKTPDGTRIATPQQNPAGGAPAAAAVPPSGSGAGTPRSGSYAGAVKTAPANWHLEFYINGNKLSLQDTIYSAVHRNQNAQSGSASANMFNLPVVIKFRKVDGPAETKAPLDAPSPASVTSAMPAGLDTDTPTSKILRLLRVVHNLTVEARDLIGPAGNQLDENLFVNNKLTAKLTRQLEETMILASNCLPEWAVELPKTFSFLFPFDTRYSYVQSTSFGYGRLISRSQSGQNSRNSHRRDDIAHLARLVRQKVRISRTQLLESCAKVLELYGTSNGILEVEYFDEIGTGLGPTLEFYSLASKEFARRSLKIWRDEDESKEGSYVFHPKGLFPAPLLTADKPVSTDGSPVSWFKTLGLFTGRALLDSRIIDVNLNKVFLKLILGQNVKKSIGTLKSVDLALARSLERLQTYLYARKEIEALKLPASSRRNKLAALTINGAKLSDLSLDFTLPGYNYELKPGGAHIDVDDSNLEEYLERVLEVTLGSGVTSQVKAFQEGFSMIFPIKDMQVFSPEEMGLLLGNAEEDWSRETLEQALKADHGYNLDSRAVQNLIEVMVEYDRDQRRQFLQFMTGAPKLPIGGFRGLTPPFTVVRKPHEPPFKADDYLPSVMTCAQYLKMPDYTTKAVLAAQLSRAMQDGGGSFHLS